MSDRFTVLLDEENADWLDAEATDRDRSKAWIVNEALRAAHGELSIYDVNTSHAGSTSWSSASTPLETRGNKSTPAAPKDVPEGDAPDHTREDTDADAESADVGGAAGADPTHAERGDTPYPEVREAVDRAAEWWDDDDRLPARRKAATVVLEAIRESESGLSKTDILEQYADKYAVDGRARGRGGDGISPRARNRRTPPRRCVSSSTTPGGHTAGCGPVSTGENMS